MQELKALIEFANGQAEKIFRRNGIIYPMYHTVKSDGQIIVMTPPPGDKDMSVALMKAAFVLNDIERYVFIDEAWILDNRKGGPEIDMDRVRREGVRDHPDRREVLMFAAENRKGEILTATRFILRPEHGKASLSPLMFNDMTGVESKGRMVGMLNWAK